MTGPATGPATAPATGPAGTTTARRRWIAGGVAALLALGVVTALASPPTTRTYLDPAAATPGGTRALAEILRQQGATVERVTDAERALTAGDGTTVVVAYPELLGPKVVGALERLPADVVLLGVPAQVPDYLGVAPVGVAPVETRDPGCDLGAAAAAGPALTGGASLRAAPPRSAPPSGVDLPVAPAACYPSGSGATVVQVVTASGHRHTVVGSADFMTNDRLADDGNAALALNLVGGQPTVVWWLPTPQLTGTQSLTSLLPDGVWPLLAALVLVVLLLAGWRGRRLGPVVVEALPVAVPASETTEGRAEIYQRDHNRDRAAHHLRGHTVTVLRRGLGVPAGAGDEAVTAAVARATSRPDQEVRRLLYGPAPEDDRALVALSQQLSALEQEAGRR